MRQKIKEPILLEELKHILLYSFLYFFPVSLLGSMCLWLSEKVGYCSQSHDNLI